MTKHKRIKLNIQTTRYRKIRHIISSLYKIKEIDRKVYYMSYDLRKIVLNSPIGQQVKNKLQEEKVTLKWLNDNGFDKVAKVYMSFLPEA